MTFEVFILLEDQKEVAFRSLREVESLAGQTQSFLQQAQADLCEAFVQ